MKCPSCGVWNRAHFTKCFRCGADLTGAHADEPTQIQDLTDDEPITVVLSSQEDGEREDPLTQEPAAREEPIAQAPAVSEDAPAAQGDASEDEELILPRQNFSLYDDGDWDDDEELDTEAVYGMTGSSAAETPDPLVNAHDTAESQISAPENDESEMRHNAPETVLIPEQGTRKFAPLTSNSPSGETRKFTPLAEKMQAPAAQPAAVPAEPEVAPTQPGISHEIIHAIFTNPPAGAQNGHVPEYVDEPRPRKLMSRKRLPPAPEQEDEPATVYKSREVKAEPRVDNVEEFKPTARIAAKKADEQGDEFTAFASAKRNLVAEVEQGDPFDAAIELPKPELPKPEETPVQEGSFEEASPPKDAFEAASPRESAFKAPRPAPEPEQPAWVREALQNLGSNDLDHLHAMNAHPRRTQPSPISPRQRETIHREEEPETRHERSPRVSAPQSRPQYAPAAARTGLEAVARYDSARSASTLRQRNAQDANARRTGPTAVERDNDNIEKALPQGTRRPAARQEVTPRREPFRAGSQEKSYEDALIRPARRAPARGLKVQNPTRMIIVGIAALLVLALVITGAVFGIRAIIKLINERKEAPSEDQQTQQSPETNPNAPVVTAGVVNGRPGHIITFKGTDDDIIYISNENLEGSYNIPIVGGVGTLEIEDSVLIGDRYVSDDVEVTLNPVLHEAGSGKETNLDPVTFTVTPPDAYLEILSPEGGAAETTLSTYQVKIRVETGSVVTIDGDDVSDMIAEEENNLGTIVYNVSVEPTGDNSIPVTAMKKGCRSVTESIVLTRPEMTVPIELDAATPSSSQSDKAEISGKVEAGVKVTVDSPIDGQVQQNDDGSFKFTAKLKNFGENQVIITASKGDENSSLTHVVTYTPSYNEYVAKAYRMDYDNLVNSAGMSQPFLCRGNVVEVYQQEPYTCLFNVGSADNPKYIYLEMVESKPLETDKTYKVYADVHQDSTKDGYPYMIGRFFVEAE